MSNLVTVKQALALRKIGYKEPTIRYAYDFDDTQNFILQKDIKYLRAWKKAKLILPVPTVDEAIDWLRRKHYIDMYGGLCLYKYNCFKRILYEYIVTDFKRNEYISTVRGAEIYALKRKAIQSVIRYIKNRKKDETKLRKHSTNREL